MQLIHVSFFGEAEFWMSLIKALVIVMCILLCFILALGGGPNHHRSGFWYWEDPGAFAQYLGYGGSLGKFLGVWASIVQATFAYLGTELVGVAFGETPNPRKNVPRAVRQTLLRIILFYIGGVITIGMAVPWNDKELLTATKQKTSGGRPTSQCLVSCVPQLC
jgi:yeast amino acid transporter